MVRLLQTSWLLASLRAAVILAAGFVFVANGYAQTPTQTRTPTDYVVGTDDIVNVTVFGQAQLSGKFTVQGDGSITYPSLGRIKAGGRTVQALEDEIRKGLGEKILRDPQVSIAVEQYRSQSVQVMGAVGKPGMIEFRGSLNVVQALAQSGGVTEEAGQEALIMRTDSPSIRLNIESLYKGAADQNVLLKAGDTVVVEKAGLVYVTGHVASPGEYKLRTGMMVRQVLALAGGVTDRGSDRRIQIIRMVDGKPITYSGKAEDVVQAGDTVHVREKLF